MRQPLIEIGLKLQQVRRARVGIGCGARPCNAWRRPSIRSFFEAFSIRRSSRGMTSKRSSRGPVETRRFDV